MGSGRGGGGTKTGEYTEVPIPPELKEQYEQYEKDLIEKVVETDAALMERYFAGWATECGVTVDDDGAQGIVTIGAVEAWRMEDAKARIMAIVAPPMAELGATYMGRVVNMTKFGAFVNILPGRDGLVHISKLGKGKRINNVEDVLTLGQEIEVIVEEIDEKGKVSLTPGESWDPVIPEGASSAPSSDRGDRGGRDRDRGGRDRGGRDRDRDRDRGPRSSGGSSDGAVSVSFDDAFDAELAGELGDLGPGGEGNGDDRGDRGGRRRHR